MTEIRTFAESDCTELRELFGRAGEDAPPLWGDEESEAAIYLNPYMDLEPDSLFVAVADGALVGYLTGCLDSFKFPWRASASSKPSGNTACSSGPGWRLT